MTDMHTSDHAIRSKGGCHGSTMQHLLESIPAKHAIHMSGPANAVSSIRQDLKAPSPGV